MDMNWSFFKIIISRNVKNKSSLTIGIPLAGFIALNRRGKRINIVLKEIQISISRTGDPKKDSVEKKIYIQSSKTILQDYLLNF